MLQATLFQALPLQQAEAQVPSAASQPSSQAVTDVIQQLLELSEPVEASPAPPPGQPLSITVGISQDILQVSALPALRWVCRRPRVAAEREMWGLVSVTESSLKTRPI